MNLDIDPEWLLRMVEKEDAGIISVGGFMHTIFEQTIRQLAQDQTIEVDAETCISIYLALKAGQYADLANHLFLGGVTQLKAQLQVRSGLPDDDFEQRVGGFDR